MTAVDREATRHVAAPRGRFARSGDNVATRDPRPDGDDVAERRLARPGDDVSTPCPAPPGDDVAARRVARPSDDAPAPLSAGALYGRLLASAVQHLDGDGPAPRARIRRADGALEPLPLDRWLSPCDAADEVILADVEAPVLDLGCGPGRHLARLRELGKDGLGVDLSPVAVELARERGATAINGSLWESVPGTYRTVLLLDGNIGIGGSPVALLKRAGELLEPGGAIVVETGEHTRRVRVRIEAPGVVSEWFRWAWVGADDAAAIARRAGFRVADSRALSGRTFVTLVR